MKRFEVYRNIRKKAIIFGLPLALFALMMTSIVGSLLVIIFSFNFYVIITMFLLNAVLYISLTRFSANPQHFQFSKVFPQIISSKKSSLLHYDKD